MEFSDLPVDETLDGRPLGVPGVGGTTNSGSPASPAASPSGSTSTASPLAIEELSDDDDDATPASRTGRGRLLAFGIIAVAAITIFGVGLMPSRSSAAVKVADTKLKADPVGQMAPEFTANKLDGSGSLSLAGLRGKVVVVNFWASWCTTCKEEAAVLGAVEKQWRDKGVVFVGIDSRDTTAPAQAFEEQYGMSYQSVVDPNAEIGQHFYVTGFPETYFLDKTGKVVEKYVSAIDATTLNQYVAAAVAAN
jgi:cytochrome c biogenesis protein CcmG/thiol:disulfide interchange protein DsbE